MPGLYVLGTRDIPEGMVYARKAIQNLVAKWPKLAEMIEAAVLPGCVVKWDELDLAQDKLGWKPASPILVICAIMPPRLKGAKRGELPRSFEEMVQVLRDADFKIGIECHSVDCYFPPGFDSSQVPKRRRRPSSPVQTTARRRVAPKKKRRKKSV